jgi:Family of unknown function (DUF6535)
VTALAAVSIQDLRPNTQDTSSFYLEKLYQFQANPDVSNTSFHSVEVKPPAFSPPEYAIWVNLLWFLSLVISLTCAMLATLLQQWARRYIRTTQLPRSTPHKRAQMRAFFVKGVDRFQVAWAVETLPALVHLSVFLFFAGLLIFLLNVNHTVFGPVCCWVVLSSAVYACITFLPIFWPDSPYYAPLSSAAWLLCTTIPYVFFAAMTFIPFRHRRTFWNWVHFCDLRDRYRRWILGGIEKAAEEITSERTSEINCRIVDWTVEALGEDDALEKFLEAIPGFYQTDVTEEHDLPQEVQKKIEIAAGKFLNRTFSSGSVCKSVLESRVSTCLNAAFVVGGHSGVAEVLRTMVDGNLYGGPQSVEMGHFLMRWVKRKGVLVAVMAEVRCIVALILQSAREHDDRWKALTQDHLGISEQDLEHYLAHGDTVLLASLICVIFQLSLSSWDWMPFSALKILSTLDICDTVPTVRGIFCLMWNQLFRIAEVSGAYSPPVCVLNCIRHLYISAHHSSNSQPTAFSDSTNSLDEVLFKPSSYPLCHGHGPRWWPNYSGEVPSILTDPHLSQWMRDAVAAARLNRNNDLDPVEDLAITTPPTRLDASFKSLPSSTPEHTTSSTVDESPLSDTLSPISTSPHSPVPVSLVNPVKSLDPDIAITNEHHTTPSTPTGSSFDRDGSYMHSPPSLSFLVHMRHSPQHTTDCRVISPLNPPGRSTSLSLPLSLPENTQHSDLQSLTIASASQAGSDQTRSLCRTTLPALNRKHPTC